MKSIFFLAAIAAPLIALAEPGDTVLAEVVRRQTGSRLLARSGIDPSSISEECQSQCSPVITTLDACNGVASCECTQANYNSLGNCLNCLQALSAPYWAYGPGSDWASEFAIACEGFGVTLSDITITADSTGTAFSVNPFSIFEPTTTASTSELTAEPYPLLPTQANSSSAGNPSHPTQTTSSSSGKTGGAVRLSALRSLHAGVVGAVTAVVVVLGGFPL